MKLFGNKRQPLLLALLALVLGRIYLACYLGDDDYLAIGTLRDGIELTQISPVADFNFELIQDTREIPLDSTLIVYDVTVRVGPGRAEPSQLQVQLELETQMGVEVVQDITAEVRGTKDLTFFGICRLTGASAERPACRGTMELALVDGPGIDAEMLVRLRLLEPSPLEELPRVAVFTEPLP
ncbi:MAG: hypothetical protein KDH09_06365 [Chrysiogenetes bacterium]|nr:hypothetical protein [Chrysiogenetes bacterium]